MSLIIKLCFTCACKIALQTSIKLTKAAYAWTYSNVKYWSKKHTQGGSKTCSHILSSLSQTHFAFCKFDTRFEAAKAADPPTTHTSATTTCRATSQGYSSGTKNTKAGPRSKRVRLSVERVDGVDGFVAAERRPNSSAFDSKPSCSIVANDSPAFSAADSNPAFSAFVSNRSCSTLVSSFTGGFDNVVPGRGPGSPRGNTVSAWIRKNKIG